MVAVLVVAKDIYVAMGAAILHFSGRVLVAEASAWGKMATLLQILTVGIALMAALANVPAGVLQVLFVLTGLVTVFACVSYIWRGAKVFSDEPVRDHQTRDI